MNLIKKVILSIAALFAVFMENGTMTAQNALVDVRIDSAAILIGEQTALHLTVTTAKDKPVRILIPTDTLMKGVEILSVSAPDSTLIENDKLVIKQNLLLTSFDSSLYLLPPLKVVDGMDTIQSNQVALKVSTVPVHVDKPEEFYDIKEIWKAPFVLADYYAIIYGVLLTLFLICVVVYIVQRLRKRRSSLPVAAASAPKLPPYEQAIKELDSIKKMKLWQQGLNKEYYTALTETVRKYIVDRFGVNAMEMTSAEILDMLSKEEIVVPVYDRLKQILLLADYVKFAKIHPLPDENDLSLTNAYLFVNETKQKMKAADQEEGEEVGNEISKDTNDSKIKN
ncbi:MAG TPA: hypothetical protein DDZ04_08915 [Parabacteroides sp.]|nr:hypothetical protein [Parabacteroides sp.]